MRRDTWAVWMLAVLCMALPAAAEEAPLPAVDLGGSAGPMQLEGMARRTAEDWFGWAGAQVVRSKDGGKSWTGVGLFPQTPVRTLVFPKDGRVFAETGAGKLLVSRDSGYSWEQGKGWLEPYDFAVAAGRKPGETAPTATPEFPLDCLLTAPASVVKVRAGVQAGAAKPQSVLELELSPDQVALSGERMAEKAPVKVGSRKLSREEGLRIVQALVEAVRRQEDPAGCGASNASKTVIEWSCNPEQSWRRKVELQAGDCAPAEAYVRGAAVQKAATQALADASR